MRSAAQRIILVDLRLQCGFEADTGTAGLPILLNKGVDNAASERKEESRNISFRQAFNDPCKK